MYVCMMVVSYGHHAVCSLVYKQMFLIKTFCMHQKKYVYFVECVCVCTEVYVNTLTLTIVVLLL